MQYRFLIEIKKRFNAVYQYKPINNSKE